MPVADELTGIGIDEVGRRCDVAAQVLVLDIHARVDEGHPNAPALRPAMGPRDIHLPKSALQVHVRIVVGASRPRGERSARAARGGCADPGRV